MKHISEKDFEKLMSNTFEKALFHHKSPIIEAENRMSIWLKKSKISEREKAELFSSFVAQSTQETIGRTLPVLADMIKADTQFTLDGSLRDAQVNKIKAETLLINAQTAESNYQTNYILPQQKALLEKQVSSEIQTAQLSLANTNLANARKLLTDAEKSRVNLLSDDEELKLKAETALVNAQKLSEDKRGNLGGLIDMQIKREEYQGNSFKAHNFQKGADSMAQVMGSIVMADGVPHASFVSAWVKLVEAGARVSDPSFSLSVTTVK